MLQLTPAAANYLAEARRIAGHPEYYGLRVATAPAAGDALHLSIAFVEFPADDDDVSEHEGTRLFVAREVLDALGPTDAAISVARTEEGSSLVLIDHPGNGAG